VIPRNVQITLVLLLVAILGSGIYILLLHRRTEEGLRRASDQRPVAAPVAGSNETVKLTIAYDEDGVFRTRYISAIVPSESSARAKSVLEALIGYYLSKPSPHELADGSAVNSVFMVNQKLAVVDLNQALADGHRSGVMVEDFTVISLIDTLATNLPQVEQVKILINGKERETLAGHADIRSIYSTTAIHKVVAQLQ
jgi:Sporulation and spore germination